MLIYFFPDENKLNSQENLEKLEQLFSELARSSVRTHHFVILNRASCEWAIDNLDLGKQVNSQLNYLKSKFTERKILLRDSPCHLEITLGNTRPQRKKNATDKYTIGHIDLLNGNYLEKPYLLVEHAKNDGDFLKIALLSVREYCPIKSFNFDPCHGGGSSIEEEFRRLHNNKRVITSFFDSDRHTPSCGPSRNLRRISRFISVENVVGKAGETSGKEVENYLPLKIIQNSRIRPEYRHFKKLEDITSKDNECKKNDNKWLYFDVKAGISVDSVEKKSISNQKKDWIKKEILLDEKEIPGLGDNILRNFLDSNECELNFRNLIKTKQWREQFADDFANIYWYLVAEKKKATRTS